MAVGGVRVVSGRKEGMRDMASGKPRRLVDAVDGLVRELRLANRIAVLALTPSQLEDTEMAKLSHPNVRARHERLNRVRALVRAAIDEEVGHGD